MSGHELIVVVLTSTSVSAIITWLLKTLIQHLLDRRLQGEIARTKNELMEHAERLKGEINLEMKRRGELAEKRLDVYPAIVELAYRIRSMARDVCEDMARADRACAKAFAKRTKEMEETIAAKKYYLDTDGTWNAIHKFKICAVTFNILLGDILHLEGTGDTDGAKVKHICAIGVYNQLDELHSDVNRKIMTAMASPPTFQAECLGGH